MIIAADDPLLVNALQRRAAVVLQKSLREGFGLTVSEAMWKGRAVIGGDVGGIRHQIVDGHSGCLVSDVPQAAAQIGLLWAIKSAPEYGPSREGAGSSALPDDATCWRSGSISSRLRRREAGQDFRSRNLLRWPSVRCAESHCPWQPYPCVSPKLRRSPRACLRSSMAERSVLSRG